MHKFIKFNLRKITSLCAYYKIFKKFRPTTKIEQRKLIVMSQEKFSLVHILKQCATINDRVHVHNNPTD